MERGVTDEVTGRGLVTSRSTWATFALTFALVLGNAGVWCMPNITVQHAVSQNLTTNVLEDPHAHYMYLSYLEPALFGALGGRSLLAFMVYVAAVSLAFVGLFVGWFTWWHGKTVALGESKLLAAASFPVFMLPFYWLGMDGMTLLLMLAVLCSLPSRWSLIPAVMLGAQHFEQGLLGFLVLAGSLGLSWWGSRAAESTRQLKATLSAIAGVGLGRVLLGLWFRAIGLEIGGDRSDFFLSHTGSLFTSWTQNWALIGWSLLGCGWLLVLLRTKTLWPFMVCTGAALGATFLAADHTRVGVIMLFPSLFHWVLKNRDLWKSLTQTTVAAIIVLNLVVPVEFVWGPRTYGRIRPYDLAVSKQLAAGTAPEKIDWTLPFGEPAPDTGRHAFFAARELPGQVGVISGLERVARAPTDHAGLLSFGPYVELPAGRFIARITYSSGAGLHEKIGWTDMTSGVGQHAMLKTDLYGTASNPTVLAIPFTLTEPTRGLEVRVWFDGVMDLRLQSIDLRASDGP
jgi:hypothetical protein